MTRTWRWMGLQIVQTIGMCWAVVAEKLRSLSKSERKTSTHVHTEGLFYNTPPFFCHTSHWRENSFQSWSTLLKVCYSLSEHILFNSCSFVHKRLVRKANILHRDIRINNIMMYKPKDESHAPPFNSQGPHVVLAPLKQGLLIDFDYAAYLDAINQITSPGHWTVRHLLNIWRFGY